MTVRPLISLAVIARDEAAALPRLLDGHRGLWDEAVVIDTGSGDGTADIARELGADVAFFPWGDDFSAARNAALARCRLPWVLVLDCDEAIARDDQEVLRAVIEQSPPAGFILPQWNYSDDPGLRGWQPVTEGDRAPAAGASGFVIAHQVRLFPGGGTIRYSGRVHETVEPSLLALGLPLHRLALPVHHHGHRSSPGVRAARCARDGRLLRRKLNEAPHDPRARFEMASQLLAEGQPELARRLLERLIAEAPSGPRSADARRLLGRLHLEGGRREDACRCFADAVIERPDVADAWLDLVRARWSIGDRPGARQALEQGRRLFPADVNLAALAAQVQAPSADMKIAGTGSP